jgi:amino acid transporter
MNTSHNTMRPELGLWQASALNITNMIGIGPFITIPMFIAAMGGPQAMIAWVIAAVLVVCDGLVWAELGAALPGSGGTYHFLKQVFRDSWWGRILPFLFIWQFLFSGTLELASGYIGTMNYVKYALPGLESWLIARSIPGTTSTLAAAMALLVTALLCRGTSSLGRMSLFFCAGTMLTVLIVIVSGLWHFNLSGLQPPPDAWNFSGAWLQGLGAAMTIAIYDYLGYYNICHLGDEVRNPARTIPRAVLISIFVVAAVYLTMNVSIIAVVPWREAMVSPNVAALFMEKLYGLQISQWFSWLVVWTAVACVFALTAGYSRIPYAASKGGDFFKVFGRLHRRHHYPLVSLWSIGLLSAVFCYFSLDAVISAAVTVRIVVQFCGQIFAVFYVRRHRPDIVLPFRMWLFPVPALVALAGWMFLMATSRPAVLGMALLVLLSGILVFAIWNPGQSRSANV